MGLYPSTGQKIVIDYSRSISSSRGITSWEGVDTVETGNKYCTKAEERCNNLGISLVIFFIPF